ncbi:element excision factor XisH family protein [Trichormus azollae]
MSAKGIFHNVVSLALGKENWQITHDPLILCKRIPEY